MKATPKITRVKLKVSQKTDSVLLGIVSSEPDYKLSLSLNKILKISLKNSDPVVLSGEQGQDLIFSRFSFSSPASELIYDLISNRCGTYYLLKKLQNIDYLFHVHNAATKTKTDQIISLLKNAEYVTAVFIIDAGSLKDKNLRYIIH